MKTQKYRALNRLAALFKNANDAVIVQDIQGKIMAWNNEAGKMYGYTESKALMMNISQIVPLKEQKKLTESFEWIEKGNNLKTCETQRITKKGKILDIRLIAICIFDRSGKIGPILTIEKDITKIKDLQGNTEVEVKILKDYCLSVHHAKK